MIGLLLSAAFLSSFISCPDVSHFRNCGFGSDGAYNSYLLIQFLIIVWVVVEIVNIIKGRNVP